MGNKAQGMSSINAALLEKYHLGQCTPEEREQVEHWIAHQETTFPDLDLAGDADALKDRLWQRLERQMPESVAGIPQEREWPARMHISLFRTLAAACAVALVAWGIWLYRPEKVQRQAAVSNAPSWQVAEMPNGKRGSVTLPDGTVVRLNGGSSLRYPSRFPDSARVVSLSGEAFFEVTKDSLRPFSVRSARNSVTVLGTKFNFKTYASGRVATVAVKEGKVRFSDLNNVKQNVILIAGEQATREAGERFRKSRAYLAELAAWTENRLAFDNEPMTDIAATLERWYDVKVEIRTAALRGFRYTGSYADPSLELLCKQLAFVLKCDYEIAGRKVIFY